MLSSTHRDRVFVVLVILVATVFALIPTVIGRSLTPTGSSFIGNIPQAPADFSVYYGYINEGRMGHWLMYDVFTSEPHTATLIQPVWFVLGQLGRLTGLAAPTLFVIGRLMTIPVLIMVLWWAAKWFWPDDHHRRHLGLWLSIFSGGLGGLAVLITNPTLSGNVFRFPDLWVTEMYPWLSLWGSPHFLLVTAGTVFIVVAVQRSWQERRWTWALWASAVALGVTAIHPFHVITWSILWLIMTTAYTIRDRQIPWRYIGYWLTVLAIVSPILLLYGLQLLTDPITIGRATQNINITDVWWRVAVGLGLPLMAAGISWRWLRWRSDRWLFVAVWCLSFAAAIYLPVSFQRRLGQGMMIPIAWLATETFYRFLVWGRSQPMRRVLVILAGTITVSSIVVMLTVMTKTYTNDARYQYGTYYLTSAEQQAAKFFATTDPHQPFLGTIFEGNMLGGLSAHQTFIGYGAETLRFSRKDADVHAFYRSLNQDVQRAMLQAYQLCYVIDSERTRNYGSAFQPSTWADLKLVWQQSGLSIYQTPYCR